MILKYKMGDHTYSVAKSLEKDLVKHGLFTKEM